MRAIKRFLLRKLPPAILPAPLLRRIELKRMLTLLARELVFSDTLDTPVKRRRATRQYLVSCAAALNRPFPDLVESVYEASRLPMAADEAYRLKLLLDSVADVEPDSSDSVNDSTTGLTLKDTAPKDTAPGGVLALGEIVLTVIIRVDEGNYFKDSVNTLADSLQSLQAQRCASWELWLVSSAENKLRAVFNYDDLRIHCVATVAQAYQQASGKLLHELSAGDCLHPGLVGELMHFLQSAGASERVFDVLYTDHDHLDAHNERCRPIFKPDWSPDVFAQYDYIGPALFFQTALARRKQVSGAFYGRRDVSGTSHAEVLVGAEIAHIPKVLYHRRWSDSQDDTVACKAARPCCYALPDVLPAVTLIIPTRDRLDMLQPCIDSILHKTTYPAYNMIIVDNQSRESATLDWLEQVEQDARVSVLSYDQPFNYADMNNFAVQHSSADIIALVNNDVEVISPGWLDEMVMHAWRPEVGCVGAKLYYSAGQVQHAGVILGANGGTAHSHRYFAGDAAGYCGRLQLVQNVSAVTGACLVLRRELFVQVGGLEAEYLPVAWNDIDLCLKVQEAGFRNLWTPYAELYHHESVSRGRDVSPEQRKRYEAEKAWMRQRWGEALWCDPYYNPNLTTAQENFAINMLYGIAA